MQKIHKGHAKRSFVILSTLSYLGCRNVLWTDYMDYGNGHINYEHYRSLDGQTKSRLCVYRISIYHME
jgi:hypothetical protein